jgi:hypothetical protein
LSDWGGSFSVNPWISRLLTTFLSPFLDGSNPPTLLIPNDLLTADALFDGVAAEPLTVADDPVASAALLDGPDTLALPISQYLLSDIILDGANPAALGVPPDQIPALALLDSFSSTTLGVANYIICGRGR